MRESIARTLTETVTGLFLLLLISISFTILAAGVIGLILIEEATTILSGLAAIGTLLLAGATLYTVRQNRQQLLEVQKDRLKPLAIDEISNIIQPSIDLIESDSTEIERKDHGRWLYHKTNKQYQRGRYLLIRSSLDPVSIERFKRGPSELYNKFRVHDLFIIYLSNLADQIAYCVEDDVRELFENSLITDHMDYEKEKDVIISAMMSDVDSFGDNAALHDFWEINKNDLNQIINSQAGDLHQELKISEQTYLEYSEELRSSLVDRRHILQDKYGISKREFESDLEGMEAMERI